jgi:hypothetical protein
MTEKEKIRFELFERSSYHQGNYRKESVEYENDLLTDDFKSIYKACIDVIELCIAERHETIDELKAFLGKLKTSEIKVPFVENKKIYKEVFVRYCDKLFVEVSDHMKILF